MNALAMSRVIPALLALGTVANAQAHPAPPPVPVELTAASRYASVDLVLGKPFAPSSRWGVFHQHTLVAGYGGDVADDLATQSQLTFAAARWLRVTAGGFYATGPGFMPTAGLQFERVGRRSFVSVSPRVNIDREESYSVFSFLEYARGRFYTNLQSLNSFDRERHIKSYQWLRVGVAVRGTQGGLAVNFDELGPKPRVDASVGLFVRRPLF